MAGTDLGGESSVLAPEDRAGEPPPVLGNVRAELAAELFRGSGIEIGALHLPMVVPPGVRVRYVDRMTEYELRAHYPELEDLDLAPVDVVDDGEGLLTFEPESVDFIVANHFLEHCEDPIRTIETHLSKLRSGGTVFYAVPDKRYTFDFRRPRTPLSHVIADHEDGGRSSRSGHYLEYVRLVYPEGGPPPDEELAQAQAAHMEATNYSIHFHVWAQADLLELVLYCQEQFGSFDIEAVRRNGLENIVVLRKHGAQVVEEAPPAIEVEPDSDGLRALTSAVHTRPAGSPPSLTIPLSALRMKLDEGSTEASWSVDPDGVKGRAFVQSAGSVVTIPLRLAGDVTFSTRVRLLPHDWRDAGGALRAWVAVTDEAGTQSALWSGSLATAILHEGNPDGVALDLDVPASSIALKLGVVALGSHSDGLVARAAWTDPRIGDFAGAPAPDSASDPQSNGASPGLTVSDKPLISVLTPVHNPPLHMLEEAIASVRSQTFSDFQLCLVDDGSTHPEVIAALERHAASDHRIELRRHETAGGISAATNSALELATGEYIALLDHDDTLAPDALQRVADQIALQPDLDMIYSDEDIVMDGQQIWLHLKPAWSPDTLRTNGYTCHLGVYRRALVNEIGGFRSEFDGSQDVDMILRLVERTDRIAHIPEILYHWRIHPASTAGGDAKPYAYVAARNAIAAHLERSGIQADVGYGPPGLYRVAHHVDPRQSIALVLAVGDDRELEAAARSWVSQPHPTWSVALAAPAHALDDCANALRNAGVADSRVTTIAMEVDWDPASALAAAAGAADAEHLLIMQTPCVGLTHDWLTRLLGYSDQPYVAAAGPVVLAGDGRIQQAGIAMPEGIPLHLLYGTRSSMDHFFGYGTSVYNVSALSGMLATRRETFERLGGLHPRFGEFALIDYCLRAVDTGGRVVIVPDARLRTSGPDVTTNDLPAMWALRRQWSQTHTHDPYYNPNFRTDRGDFEPLRD